MKTWTIGKRIVVGYAAILLVTLAMGGFSLSRLIVIKGHSDTLTTDMLPGIVTLGKIQSVTLNNKALVLKHILSTSPAMMADIEKTIKAGSVENARLYKELENYVVSPEERAMFEKVLAARAAYLGARDSMLELSRNNRNAEAFASYVEKVEPAFNTYSDTVQAEVEYNQVEGTKSGAAITRAILDSRRFMTASLVFAAALACAIGFLIIRSTAAVLNHTTRALDEGAAQLNAAAAQVSSASQSLAEGSSEQAASLEETSSSLEEMSSMTKRNAESAHNAKQLSTQTRNAADTAAADMEQMKHAMDAIKESSNDISKIIKTIDEIAFQTNILALNAAVEAARAGSAGAGFAVVADEVRNLARRSAESARETATKIEDAIQKSNDGVTFSDKVAGSLGEIVTRAREMDTLISEIAKASEEQSHGVAQINQAVVQMDQVTQSNASSAEETASAAEELNAQSLSLKAAVDDLRRLVTQAASSEIREPSAPARFAENTVAARPAARTSLPLRHRPAKNLAQPVAPHADEPLSFRDV